MRKLTDDEQRALNVLVRRGSICLGDLVQTDLGEYMHNALKGLVRKKRAYAAEGDDGPIFYPTGAGVNHAEV